MWSLLLSNGKCLIGEQDNGVDVESNPVQRAIGVSTLVAVSVYASCN